MIYEIYLNEAVIFKRRRFIFFCHGYDIWIGFQGVGRARGSWGGGTPSSGGCTCKGPVAPQSTVLTGNAIPQHTVGSATGSSRPQMPSLRSLCLVPRSERRFQLQPGEKQGGLG